MKANCTNILTILSDTKYQKMIFHENIPLTLKKTQPGYFQDGFDPSTAHVSKQFGQLIVKSCLFSADKEDLRGKKFLCTMPTGGPRLSQAN